MQRSSRTDGFHINIQVTKGHYELNKSKVIKKRRKNSLSIMNYHAFCFLDSCLSKDSNIGNLKLII